MSRDNKLTLTIVMALLIAMALAVRVPGVFWGIRDSITHRYSSYHSDESRLAHIANGVFLTGVRDRHMNYLYGFPCQVANVGFLVAPFISINKVKLILIGRVISVSYGILTGILIYFLARELFLDPLIALLASAFLFLSGLHATESHYGTADAGVVFWIYATIFFSLLSIRRRQKDIYFIFAILACGLGLAFKLAWVSLIPILYVLVKEKRELSYYLFTLFCLFLTFVIATGANYTPISFIFTLKDVFFNNLNVIKGHNKFLNPVIYFIELIPGLGLPVFLLLLYGGVRLFCNKKVYFKNLFRSDVFYIAILPLLLHFISICLLDIPFPRHKLPLIPLLCIIASYGLVEMKKSKIICNGKVKFSHLILVIFIYQLIYVSSTEYYFLFETRRAAGKWIKENIPQGEEITITPIVHIPFLEKDYKIVDTFDSPFLVLHEAEYYKYFRSELNPFKRYPGWNEIYQPRDDHFVKIPALFRGELNYKLIKKFEVKGLTPELYWYKRFFGTYPKFIGDVVIYKRIDA